MTYIENIFNYVGYPMLEYVLIKLAINLCTMETMIEIVYLMVIAIV